jgi:hypothetical protein
VIGGLVVLNISRKASTLLSLQTKIKSKSTLALVRYYLMACVAYFLLLPHFPLHPISIANQHKKSNYIN